MEGSQVGAYAVQRCIGEGGMGAVYLAEHVVLHRRAALKVLHPEFSHRTDIVTRFFNEARAATAIDDPGIVQIFDFGHHTDGSAYIVMELLNGESLDTRLRAQGALDVRDSLRIMRQVASTLDAAHARGIIHRDLKPGNVFLVRDPEVPGGERAKILDFGIAKLTNDKDAVKTDTNAVMGTPTYMSPEQCRGAGEVDRRSDVYAIGCLVFALVSGRPPFEAEGAGALIAMHLLTEPPLLSSFRPGIPIELDQLVARCLAKDPAHRFQTAGELASALAALLATAGHATVAKPITAVPRSVVSTTLSSSTASTSTSTSPSSSTRRGRLIAIALGVVVAGAVAGFVALHQPDDPEAAGVGIASTPPVRTTPPPPPASTAPPKRDPRDGLRAQMKAALGSFVAWSRNHAGAACPTGDALGNAHLDPWDHPYVITCTDQPADQIVGVISAGPDGIAGTADDVQSWQLGQDLTDIVRGNRWRVTPVVERTIGSRRPTHPVRDVPKVVAPPDKTADPKPPTSIPVDENGMPINR